MKLSAQTRAILQNYKQINPSIIINPGSLITTKSTASTVYAESTTQETFTEQWSIYSLNQFLQVISLIGDDADIVVDPNNKSSLLITGNGVSISYRLSDPSLIVVPKQRLQIQTSNLKFDLKYSQLKQLMTATKHLSLDTVAIASQDGKIVLRAFDRRTKNSNVFSLDICEYQGSNKFNFLLDATMLELMESDYVVDIVTDINAVQFTSSKINDDTKEQSKYIIAMIDDKELSYHDF